jgi:hypothetical protein
VRVQLDLAHWRGRADDRQGEHALGPARREGAGDGPADLGADEVKVLDAERVHQPDEIADDDVERPGKVARHRRRAAKTAHVRADDAEVARGLASSQTTPLRFRHCRG